MSDILSDLTRLVNKFEIEADMARTQVQVSQEHAAEIRNIFRELIELNEKHYRATADILAKHCDRILKNHDMQATNESQRVDRLEGSHVTIDALLDDKPETAKVMKLRKEEAAQK